MEAITPGRCRVKHCQNINAWMLPLSLDQESTIRDTFSSVCRNALVWPNSHWPDNRWCYFHKTKKDDKKGCRYILSECKQYVFFGHSCLMFDRPECELFRIGTVALVATLFQLPPVILKGQAFFHLATSGELQIGANRKFSLNRTKVDFWQL